MKTWHVYAKKSIIVQKSIAVYTSEELDIDEDGKDGNVKVKNWIEEGRKRLDAAREALHYLCEPVELPREVEQYLHYFCGDANDPNALQETEQLRISFYKAVVTFLRAFAAIAQDLAEAGYTNTDIIQLQSEAAHFTDIRKAIKQHSGEELDIKPYEADMRHLINTYIQADQAEGIDNLGTIAATTFQCPADEDEKAQLALELDAIMRERAPAGWKRDADGPRGKQVLNSIFPIMAKDREATTAIFEIIKNQPGY